MKMKTGKKIFKFYYKQNNITFLNERIPKMLTFRIK